MSETSLLELRLKLVPTTRRLVYFFVYSTWGNTFRLAPCPINETEGSIIVDRPAEGTVLPHYSTIILQMGEMIDNRLVLTGVAMVPLADMQPHFVRAISFVDASQSDAVLLEGTIYVAAEHLPLLSTIEPDLPTLLDRFDGAVEDYGRRADAFVATMDPSRADLVSLYMTSFKQRIGHAFPDLMFFNMERSAPTDKTVLESLLRIACFYIGMEEGLFQQACQTIAEVGKGINQPKGAQGILLDTAMEIVVFAACLPAILTPYAFDKYVTAFGEVKTGERFSSFRVPTKRRRDAVMDCEEMAKLVATLLFDMQQVEGLPGGLLGAAKQALEGAGIFSSLMLVKNPNVDTAATGDNDTVVPLNGSTGHMCGLLHAADHRYTVASIPLSKPREEDEGALNGVYLAEGTGNILSDIRPYEASHRATNEALQTRIRSSPFGIYKWEQRLNMTHGTLFVDDPMSTPNNFYTVLKFAFPIYRGMQNARSYLAVNAAAHTYGVPVSNLVAAGTDATLLLMPEMTVETRALCSAMMGFIPPEMPLTIGPDPSASAKRDVSDWNGRIKKGDPHRAAFVCSFMKDYGEVRHHAMEEIIVWVRQNADIIHCDMMLFGQIMHSTLLIIRLFFA